MTVDELIALISQSPRHKHLYHFTDTSNLRTINERGILSKGRMQSEDFRPERMGGNQLSHRLDVERGIDHDVSLCFTYNHPMKYFAHNDGRIPNPRHLKISPCVLKTPGVRIALGIANAGETQILPIEEAIRQLDVEVIYSITDWSNPAINRRLTAAEKFEVLVPDMVPRTLIKGTI